MLLVDPTSLPSPLDPGTSIPILHLPPAECANSSEDSDSELEYVGYQILAVSPQTKVPRQFQAKQTVVVEPPPLDISKVVSRPYLLQAICPPVEVESSADAAALAKALFSNLLVSIPLATAYKEIPSLQCAIAKWECKLSASIHLVTPPFR